MEKIESVSCCDCGGVDVSYSPDQLFKAYCWNCQNYVDVIIRTVTQ